MTDSTVTRHDACFERCNDESLDPFLGAHTSVMATFRASVGREANALAPQLCKQVFNASDIQPHVCLMLTESKGGGPIILVLHRPHRHVAPMGSNIGTKDIAFLRDMRGLLPSTVVHVPEDGFVHTGDLLVPRTKTLDQAFAGDPTLQAVGPCKLDKAGTDAAATRPLICLPPKHAPIMLANPSMTPRKAWESVACLICTGDDAKLQVQAMQPLLDWIRRAACAQVLDDDDHALISKAPACPHPAVPLLDRAVETRLKLDLPGLI